jgi:hypothetical protein
LEGLHFGYLDLKFRNPGLRLRSADCATDCRVSMGGRAPDQNEWDANQRAATSATVIGGLKLREPKQ